MGKSYIIKSAVHLPQKHDSSEVTEYLYEQTAIKKLARRFSGSTEIENRFLSIELGEYPDKKILSHETPLDWLSILYRKLFGGKHADFISLSYNMSSHENFVPTLSSQLCSALGLDSLAFPPEEHLFMGCASAVFAINSASKHCNLNPYHTAFVTSYEQSSWLFNPENERNAPDFIPSLRGHALFGDGAAGLMIAGEEAAIHYGNKLQIIDAELAFVPGRSIGMKGGRFLVGDTVGVIMPDLVTKKVIRPLLNKYNLTLNDIEQWSIHQGSHNILNEFSRKDILGLSDAQLKKSHDMFTSVGNVSSPSCLFVLNEWLNDHDDATGKYGLIVGFGAGYYMGAVLYKHV